MSSIRDLWEVADQFALDGDTNAAEVFECGLLLQRPLKRWEYFCTPLNTLTFASTGGDGTHYGFLELRGLPLELFPVVMTVPMSDRHNVVVAETFSEFLGLGYFAGWFSLEQIIYDPVWAVEYHNLPHEEESPSRESLLTVLRETLDIKHTPLSLERIAELDEKYFSLLVLSPEYERQCYEHDASRLNGLLIT